LQVLLIAKKGCGKDFIRSKGGNLFAAVPKLVVQIYNFLPMG
jgi:hypothetical protein